MFHKSANIESSYNTENAHTNLKIYKLKEALHQTFPIRNKKGESFELYPFSNEMNYEKVLNLLESASSKKTNKLRVAILFGESNFLSMIPELAKHADLILLADIEFRLHQHTKHLLDCFNKANNPQEFIDCYKVNNPIENQPLDWLAAANLGILQIAEITVLKDILLGKIEATKLSLTEKKHFLLSEERYKQCKQLRKNLSFIHIDFDLMDPQKAHILSDLLKSFESEITLCNFTNIHDYDDQKKLSISVSALLRYSNDYFVMYSQGEKIDSTITKLQSSISLGLIDYFKYALKVKLTEQEYINNGLTSVVANSLFLNNQEIYCSSTQNITNQQKVNFNASGT